MLAATSRPLSAVFWNVWVESQLSGTRLQHLLARFDTIIAEHQPDVFGLNEVLSHDGRQLPPLLEHLERRGYHTFFAPFSPESNGNFSGSAFASRVPADGITVHELGPDKYGARRGYSGNTIKLIQARLLHAGVPVHIVVNYLAHLMPYNWNMHLKHHRAFRAVMRAPELQRRTIIGGDFNQFKFMPRLWGARSLYDRATGTLLHPTWKLLGGKIPVIRANYDNIFWTKCGTVHLQDFRVLERAPSDHAPLFARFHVQP
ncbi:MAG TPA: endonuclease/exonuclease/phosphatase family protein [Candidatus Saccharimonadales bacterium]|nr:endonuclease/exonuclease/phosphatase family protein [Candidatus Saccharimonadales bacterium]